jgi:M6 family metalloprotease-like protein
MKGVTMKNLLKILLSTLILSISIEIKPAPFDTGMIILTQPNEVTFTGRIWGDEFFYWAETEDGYRFVQSGDGWYYYAALDGSGEFTKTTYKVGIDSPPASSYQLERTQARIDEINQQIEQFNEQIELNRQWFVQKQEEAQGLAVTLKVGIILIEFSDTTHYTAPYRPNGYTTADFDSMMFSYNYWTGVQGNLKHPEEEAIFGSFRDYWDQMSRGKFKITGKVVNPTDENGVPEWLVASGTRQHYLNYGGVGGYVLAQEAYDSALANGYISEDPGDSNYYDKYAVVYALEAIHGNITVGGFMNGKIFYLAERSGPNLYGGLPQDKSFTHIGIYAHEFGHNIGYNDEYVGGYDDKGGTDLLNFCLMAWGIYNGPESKAACPATLSPWYRIDNNWVSQPVLINSDTVNFLFEYDYNNPKLYRINPIKAINDEHYIIETKNRDGFDLYIPGEPSDTVNQTGRLLIWHSNVNRIRSSYETFIDRVILKAADNLSDDSTQLTDFFPSTFYPNYQDFNDTTSPSTTLGNTTTPDCIDNERLAHFALNGIQKLGNGNTIIDEIKLNHAIIRNNITSGWKTLSVGAILSDYSASSVFPTAVDSIVFGYVPGQGYVRRYTLENGPGYYVNFATAQTLVHTGLILDSINVRVSGGWNIIGSISDKVPKLNICTEPQGILISICYFDGGYHFLTDSDSLKPGMGYWFNSTSNGNVILLKDFECPEGEGIDLAGMDRFIVTDSEGKSQELYVANVDIDTAITEIDRSLPPPLPEIDFDARFNYGEFIKAVSIDSGEVDLEIDVQTNAYPITLSWEINPANGIEYTFLSDSGFGKISSLNKKLTFDENSMGKIKLSGKVNNSYSDNLPEKIDLFQNYPNPFNPITTIKYDLPNTSDVSLIIYDILGREVAKLVNEQQQPGSYQIKWDASTISSGIYFYSITAGDFSQTKKMILLK